ncbi:spermatogenesis-associated protein 6 isoform X2 [Orussus abietinus]|uniref:spermatogenesis-associated protein 6 isoform X2 n=1 Tax=Orussus abietinus TaxID=222816 RepID=UPI0006267D11|nr:spermatogenesis-associated protein 6 isoform X2 [Orussus abietinus]
MARRGFCVKIELDLHAITCPGVWLCPNGKVALQINTLDSFIESHRISPVFPLLFHDRFTFKKVFANVASLAELQRSLEEEFLYAELIQWSAPTSHAVILATFETNLGDVLYPAPCFKGLLAGVDVDLLMEPTKYFPGILAPKIEVSTRTVIEEVVGVSDIGITGSRIVNPKVINSKNSCSLQRKRPAKGIIRQRKVCHSQGKSKSQVSRPCRQRAVSLEVDQSCSPYASYTANHQAQTEPERCYHVARQRSKCTCPPPSPQRTSEHSGICRTAHAFDECLVCSKSGGCAIVNRNSISEKDSGICPHRPNSAPSPREDSSLSIMKAKMRQLQRTKARLAYLSRHSCEGDFDYDLYCGHSQDQGSRQGFYKNLEKFYKRMYKQAKLRAEEIDYTT